MLPTQVLSSPNDMQRCLHDPLALDIAQDFANHGSDVTLSATFYSLLSGSVLTMVCFAGSSVRRRLWCLPGRSTPCLVVSVSS